MSPGRRLGVDGRMTSKHAFASSTGRRWRQWWIPGVDCRIAYALIMAKAVRYVEGRWW